MSAVAASFACNAPNRVAAHAPLLKMTARRIASRRVIGALKLSIMAIAITHNVVEYDHPAAGGPTPIISGHVFPGDPVIADVTIRLRWQ